jgi:hypothetical protein
MRIGRAMRRAKFQREAKRAEELMRGLVANDWDPVRDFRTVVARHTGIQPREDEQIMEHLARACGCSGVQVAEWFALLKSGSAPEKVDVQVFGVTPSALMGAMKAVDAAIRAYVKVLAS